MTKEARMTNDESAVTIRASVFVIPSSLVIPSFVIPGVLHEPDLFP